VDEIGEGKVDTEFRLETPVDDAIAAPAPDLSHGFGGDTVAILQYTIAAPDQAPLPATAMLVVLIVVPAELGISFF